MSNDPAKPLKDVNASLYLACDEEAESSHSPYYELYSDGDDKLSISKVCHEHRDVITTTIEINPFRSVHVRGFKFSIKCMERDR